jgi:nicotinamidase-related amidase
MDPEYGMSVDRASTTHQPLRLQKGQDGCSEIEQVVYTGVITKACVMLTAAGGMDRGYEGYLAADATATISTGLQETAERLINGFIATITTTDQLIAALAGADLPDRPNPTLAWSRTF